MFYEDKMRYLAGKVVGKMLLKEYSGVDKVILRKRKYGKLYGKLYGKVLPGQQEIIFNHSHSGEWASFLSGDIGL